MQQFKWAIVLIGLTLSCSLAKIGTKQVEQEASPSTRARASYDMQTQIVQLTTHPEVDVTPSVSPDGNWLVFASRREKNYDLWIKPIRGGRATQITTHPADDTQPVWNPDGKSVIFVSQREDAMGDLWKVKIDIQYKQIVQPKVPG